MGNLISFDVVMDGSAVGIIAGNFKGEMGDLLSVLLLPIIADIVVLS